MPASFGEQMTALTSSILHFILHEELSDEVWYKIIGQIVCQASDWEIKCFFYEVLKSGRMQLIKLFCEHGVNPFEVSKDETNAPSVYHCVPIFGLVDCDDEKVNYSEVMTAISEGLKKFHMRELANLREHETSTLHQLYSTISHKLDDEDTEELNGEPKTLLETAMSNGDVKLADFLIKNSDTNYSNPLGFGPLHWSVLTNNEEHMEKLMDRSSDPYTEGTIYLSNCERRIICRKYFKGDMDLCKCALYKKDSFELAKMRIPPNYEFLRNLYNKREKKEEEEVPTHSIKEELKSEISPERKNEGKASPLPSAKEEIAREKYKEVYIDPVTNFYLKQ